MQRTASAGTAAVGATAVGFLLIGVALVGGARSGWPGGPWQVVARAVTTASWLGTGVVVAMVRPRLVIGWLLLFGGGCLALSAALTGLASAFPEWPGAPWAAWVANWVFYPHLGAYIVIYLLFPTGALLSRRWRPWPAFTAVAVLAATITLALFPGPLADDGPLATMASPIGGAAGAPAAFPVAVAAVNVAGLAALVALWKRARGAEHGLRGQVWMVFGLGLLNQAEGLLLIAPTGDWVYALAVPSTMLMTGAIAYALVSGRLWGVRETIGRVVTQLVATAAIGAVFVAATTLAGAVPSATAAGVPLAALLVCVGLAPFQRRLQRGVERLLYGARREPYAVVSAFGAALEAAGEPVEGLSELCRLAASSLRLPWVAVEVGGEVIAACGPTRPDRCLRLQLRHHGQELGALAVGLRAGEAGFGAADRRLLDDLARQAGAAAFAASLTASLRRSRDDLADVRERERRRLRQDLHDGVASAMTAVGLKTEVAIDLLANEPQRSAALLADARADIATALDDIRRLIDDLAPAALADLGLAGALDALARRSTTEQLTVLARTSGMAGPLPPATEAAAYWITAEALQNVARHADATRCEVIARTDPEGRLSVTVTDDGRGIDADGRRAGVGLASMAARAAELGGTCTVGPGTDGGTVVTAMFPPTRRTGADHDR